MNRRVSIPVALALAGAAGLSLAHPASRAQAAPPAAAPQSSSDASQQAMQAQIDRMQAQIAALQAELNRLKSQRPPGAAPRTAPPSAYIRPPYLYQSPDNAMKGLRSLLVPPATGGQAPKTLTLPPSGGYQYSPFGNAAPAQPPRYTNIPDSRIIQLGQGAGTTGQ